MAPLVERERQVLYGVTAGTVLGFLLMFTSTCTDYWLILHLPHGYYSEFTKTTIISYHFGLWRICREAVSNVTAISVSSK